jgi:hypothetical protein
MLVLLFFVCVYVPLQKKRDSWPSTLYVK